MDRQIVYPGQIPLETDLLNTNRNTMLALGKLAGAIFGTGGLVNGLAVAPTSPGSLDVSVGAGEIYQLANVDDTAYSSLAADTTDTVVKQGILLQPTTLSCPAPNTAGFSINYLIEAKFEESDTGSVVLPYYNASNPQQAFSGPNNTGAAQAVTRSGIVSLQAKAGIAAATGTQTTPAVDAGYIALAVVTVANGQTTIASGDIVAETGAQILSEPISSGRLLNIQTFTSSGTYTPTPGTKNILVEVQGGGGSGGGAPATSSTQNAVGSGGGSGGYIAAYIPVSSISAPVSVTVASGGTGTYGNGNSGGTSAFGTYLTANGGSGGLGAASAPPFALVGGSPGSTSSTVTTLPFFKGAQGSGALSVALGAGLGGQGGASAFGVGGFYNGTNASAAGGNGTRGAGGGGASAAASSTAQLGGVGGNGLIVIREYA